MRAGQLSTVVHSTKKKSQTKGRDWKQGHIFLYSPTPCPEEARFSLHTRSTLGVAWVSMNKITNLTKKYTCDLNPKQGVLAFHRALTIYLQEMPDSSLCHHLCCICFSCQDHLKDWFYMIWPWWFSWDLLVGWPVASSQSLSFLTKLCWKRSGERGGKSHQREE